jgi:hypothetical protein
MCEFCKNKDRGMRLFMGVGRYTPNLALYGDMGRKPCIVKQSTSVLRIWSRFTKMSECRLNRKVFLWSNRISFSKVRNWNYRVNTKLKDINRHDTTPALSFAYALLYLPSIIDAQIFLLMQKSD